MSRLHERSREALRHFRRATFVRAMRSIRLELTPAPPTTSSRDYFMAATVLGARIAGDTPPPADLTGSELRVSSQNGEDGVIAESMRRIGPSAEPSFVEFGFEGSCVYERFAGWDGSSYVGASIVARERLGDAKGYKLVHTDLAGLNAFFVLGEYGAAVSGPAVRRSPNYRRRSAKHPQGTSTTDPTSTTRRSEVAVGRPSATSGRRRQR